jgi:hypothetical protein
MSNPYRDRLLGVGVITGGLPSKPKVKEGRGEHGTVEHSPSESPFTSKRERWKSHYQNLNEEDVCSVLPLHGMYWEMSRSYMPGWGSDLRFWGIK